MRGDGRGRRVAVVSDRLVNDLGGLPDAALGGVIEQWGAMQLPPAHLGEAAKDRWVANLVDQVAEYRRHGYDAVIIHHPDDSPEDRRRLTMHLAAARVEPPDHLEFDADRPALLRQALTARAGR